MFHLNSSISRESSLVSPQLNLFLHPHLSSSSRPLWQYTLWKYKNIMFQTPFNFYSSHQLHPALETCILQHLERTYCLRLLGKVCYVLEHFPKRSWDMSPASLDAFTWAFQYSEKSLNKDRWSGAALNTRMSYSTMPSSLLLPSPPLPPKC